MSEKLNDLTGCCIHCLRRDITKRLDGTLCLHDDKNGHSCISNFLCPKSAGHPSATDKQMERARSNWIRFLPEVGDVLVNKWDAYEATTEIEELENRLAAAKKNLRKIRSDAELQAVKLWNPSEVKKAKRLARAIIPDFE